MLVKVDTDFAIVESRARRLNHQIKMRKSAIVQKREQEHVLKMDMYQEDSSPTSGNDRSSMVQTFNGHDRSGVSPTSGFVAVNSRPSPRVETSLYENGDQSQRGSLANLTKSSNPERHPLGQASSATKAELMKCFSTQVGQPSNSDADPLQKTVTLKVRSGWEYKKADPTNLLNHSGSPVPIPHTPSNLVHTVKPSPADRFEDSGPHKQEMLARMEQLNRGDRVLPPCDRCRRLHMDCLKNLTACQGCTKKHAKCSWKDVSDQELIDHPFITRAEREKQMGVSHNDDRSISPNAAPAESEDPLRPVRDEELLGEDASEESDSDSPSQIAHDEHIHHPPNTNAAATPIMNSGIHVPGLQEGVARVPSPALAITRESSTPKPLLASETPTQANAAATVKEPSPKVTDDFSKVEERFYQHMNGSPYVKPIPETMPSMAPLLDAEKMVSDLQNANPSLMSYDVQQSISLHNGHGQPTESRLWNPAELLASSEANTPSAMRDGEDQAAHWPAVNGKDYRLPFDRMQHPSGMNG